MGLKIQLNHVVKSGTIRIGTDAMGLSDLGQTT